MKNFRSITLIITHLCNLKCSYCYEHYKSNKNMSLKTAQTIIDRELVDSSANIKIEFLGGEPFLQFDLIKQIVEYVEDKKRFDKVQFCTTTNGTLIHGDIQNWLLRHLGNFEISLSLDGTRAMHNANRDNSFDYIDLNFFVYNYPNSAIKMTISQDTLPNLAEGIMFCHEKGFNVHCNLAYGIDWTKRNNKYLLEKQLCNLIEFYMRNPEIRVCSLLSEPIYKISSNRNKAIRACGAGRTMVAYDCDGDSYACQFFTPLSIGEFNAKNSQLIDFSGDEIPLDKLSKECKNCVLLPQCHLCYGANYATKGNIYHRDKYWCQLNKTIFKAKAYYYSKLFENGNLKMDAYHKFHTMKSILLINNELR